ncbi:hypothetical protein Salat_1454400 [Sesamum alatum]|uniref:Myb/SANT-like domain-containing protein n=1 Tax=Sesamum alatum TaxID=300844 RepID=A0AAE1YBM8_9LAMI|nr:hypothetical protein Salat_1454400 [Sesamum alatum]
MPSTHEVPLSQLSRADKVTWTIMERVFIELMHEKFVNGRLKSPTFSPFVWGRICHRLNATLALTYVYTIEQLKGNLNRLRRAWRLLNDLISGGTGWGWDSQLNTVIDEHGRLEELCRVENDPSIQNGIQRSRDEYEDSAYSESMPSVPLNEPSILLNEPFESFPTPPMTTLLLRLVVGVGNAMLMSCK